MIYLALSLTWWLFALCLTMGLGAWFIFVWGVRSGMFRDPEEIADRLIEMDQAQTTDQSPVQARKADPFDEDGGDRDGGGDEGSDGSDGGPEGSGGAATSAGDDENRHGSSREVSRSMPTGHTGGARH